jgi:hypothetical protein
LTKLTFLGPEEGKGNLEDIVGVRALLVLEILRDLYGDA